MGIGRNDVREGQNKLKNYHHHPLLFFVMALLTKCKSFRFSSGITCQIRTQRVDALPSFLSMQRHGDVVRLLTSHGKDDSFWVFVVVNIHDCFEGNFVEIKSIAHVVIR